MLWGESLGEEAATYTKCLVSSTFHAAPPSFLARTRSVFSASLSSTIRSTSWLLPDLADLDEEDDSSRIKPLITGALVAAFDFLPMLELARRLSDSISFLILLSRRCLLALVG